MAKIDFKSLSPEEVAALSTEEKARYDKWLAKQKPEDEPESEDKPVELVKVKALKQVNTSAYGHLYPNAKEPYTISKALAEQLSKLGEVEIVG